MHHLNGYLVLAGFEQCHSINLLGSIYSDYIVPFGRVFLQTDLINPDVLTIKFAQMFTWGAQLGTFENTSTEMTTNNNNKDGSELVVLIVYLILLNLNSRNKSNTLRNLQTTE